MAQGSGLDASRLTTADKIVLGAAGIFFVWSLVPTWYRCCSVLGFRVDVAGVNGFRGVTAIAALLALLAAVEVGLRKMANVRYTLPAKPGLIHLGAAILGLVFTVLGLLSKPAGSSVSWGLFVGLLLALAWAYGAYMMYS
ncbi:MAG TPA: hypothetical protein VNO79_11485, partial [Actinomycetota bacterium]|nr:hypothetical protein [Actinomycetota bacterium]